MQQEYSEKMCIILKTFETRKSVANDEGQLNMAQIGLKGIKLRLLHLGAGKISIEMFHSKAKFLLFASCNKCKTIFQIFILIIWTPDVRSRPP